MEKNKQKLSTIKSTLTDNREQKEWKRRKKEEENRVFSEIEKEEYEEFLSDRCRDDDPK